MLLFEMKEIHLNTFKFKGADGLTSAIQLLPA